MSSVRIKDGLVILDPLCHRLDFLPRWLCRISRRRQHAELHDAEHQEDTRLGRGEIGAAEERPARNGEALGIAAADIDDGKSRIDGAGEGARA